MIIDKAVDNARSVLVVDDRPINREFLASLLGQAGYRVLVAADGRDALAMAQAIRPGLVITDVLMPVMDGVELARRVGAATLPGMQRWLTEHQQAGA